MNLSNILNGIGGEPEIGRVLLVVGVAATIIVPPIYLLADMAHNGWHFDVTAFCVSYPAGIVALVAGGVLAIASKEKSVAQARSIVAQPPLDDKTGAV
jgi:hypothetical protein